MKQPLNEDWYKHVNGVEASLLSSPPHGTKEYRIAWSYFHKVKYFLSNLNAQGRKQVSIKKSGSRSSEPLGSKPE